MNEKTIAEITQYLDTLIERAGGTVETIWPYLIKQVYVHFYISLLYFALTMVGLIVSGIGFYKASDNYKYEHWEYVCIFSGIIGAVLAIISFIPLIIYSAGLLNPEYYALKDLLSIIK